METKEALQSVARQLEIRETDPTGEGVRELIMVRIGELIANDFNRLVLLLYRLDVNEKKLYASLEENKDVDASMIITDLMIERQLQKIRSREQDQAFKKDNDIPEDESW